ncbi:hypothetical protein PCE1_003826 [Barthelona sp. PCE]
MSLENLLTTYFPEIRSPKKIETMQQSAEVYFNLNREFPDLPDVSLVKFNDEKHSDNHLLVKYLSKKAGIEPPVALEESYVGNESDGFDDSDTGWNQVFPTIDNTDLILELEKELETYSMKLIKQVQATNDAHERVATLEECIRDREQTIFEQLNREKEQLSNLEKTKARGLEAKRECAEILIRLKQAMERSTEQQRDHQQSIQEKSELQKRSADLEDQIRILKRQIESMRGSCGEYESQVSLLQETIQKQMELTQDRHTDDKLLGTLINRDGVTNDALGRELVKMTRLARRYENASRKVIRISLYSVIIIIILYMIFVSMM